MPWPLIELDDRRAAGFQLAQIDEALRQRAQLAVVETTGHFLAIARDERHRRTFVEKLDRGPGLIGTGIDLSGDGCGKRADISGHMIL